MKRRTEKRLIVSKCSLHKKTTPSIVMRWFSYLCILFNYNGGAACHYDCEIGTGHYGFHTDACHGVSASFYAL